LDVKAAAGDIRVDETVDEVRLKLASGDVSIRDKARDVIVTSASGDIRVGEVDEISVNTGSGSIILGTVTGPARIKAASGDLKLHNFSGPELTVTSMSGDTTIGLSGELRNRIKPSDEEATARMTLSVKSFSGDVTLRSPW
jgi:DUF4097 and DUF4098 domain-containing protein YvlB